jgi:hypothetical protein
MGGSTGILKIPGYFGCKRPQLDALHKDLFGEGFVGARDAAGADIEATAGCL